MKRKLCKLVLFLLIICGLTACFSRKNSDAEDFQGEFLEEENHPAFSALKDMPEITVEGNIVTVVLLQDIPLPYRWAITGQSECATLTEEYEVEDPAKGSLFSTGSASEYHVFVFELAESEVAELTFYNRWVVEPENLEEANGKRNFILEYADEQWKVILAESSN